MSVAVRQHKHLKRGSKYVLAIALAFCGIVSHRPAPSCL